METRKLEMILFEKVSEGFKYFGVQLNRGLLSHPEKFRLSFPETYLVTGTISLSSWPFEPDGFFRMKSAKYPIAFQPKEESYGNFSCHPDEIVALWHVNKEGIPSEPIFNRKTS